MLIQNLYQQTKNLAVSENISIKETIKQLTIFKKDFTIFKARINLIEKLEINAPRYSKDSKPSGYLLLSTKEEILNHILNLERECKSFRVTFKNGDYYFNSGSGSQYTSNYNNIVVNFLNKYI